MEKVTKLSLLLLLQICISLKFADAAIIYSGANGEWSAHIWSSNASGTPLCPGTCQPSCSFSGSLYIKNVVTVTTCGGAMTLSGGGFINLTGSTSKLTITGNLTVTGNSTMLIPASDTLTINGNLSVQSVSTITVNGYIKINGNVTTAGNSSVCGTGAGLYTGTLTGPAGTPGWCFAPVSLPIRLYSFSADYLSTSNIVKLAWITASEINNNYFTIEKSLNGENFQSIGQVKGAGNSNIFSDYYFYDNAPYKGVSYYRLLQTDYDGNTTTYNVVPVETYEENQSSWFLVFPNPIKENSINLTYNGDNIGDKITFIIQDLTGRIIMEETVIVNNKGSTEYLLYEESRLNKGIYFITGSTNNKLTTQKLIVN